MGAAGTALGAADARTNEHYEIGTILTQKSQGDRPDAALCTRKQLTADIAELKTAYQRQIRAQLSEI